MKIMLVILKGMIVMYGTIKGFKVRQLSKRKAERLPFCAELNFEDLREKAVDAIKGSGRVYVLINKSGEIAGGYIFSLNKSAEFEGKECSSLELTEEFFSADTEAARPEFDEALKVQIKELTALSTIRFAKFGDEIIIYAAPFECSDDEDGEHRSLLAMIVLFIIFRHIFNGVLLALLFAYVMSPMFSHKETNNNKVKETEE